MSELRKDPLTDRRVIFARERGRRPSDFTFEADVGATPTAQEDDALCPFCPGNEDQTPAEVYALRPAGAGKANTPGWLVRVVPNKFPALAAEGAKGGHPHPPSLSEGLFERQEGVGVHEVIVESPHHHRDLPDLAVEQVEGVIQTYIQRLKTLQGDGRFRYVLPFKNAGRAAGASLAHPHSQVIATAVLPPLVRTELEAARAHYERTGRCLLCDVLEQELAAEERLIEADGYVIWSPFAARFPFETWIAPAPCDHGHDFAGLAARKQKQKELAAALKRTLQRLKAVLSPASGSKPRRGASFAYSERTRGTSFAYNFVVHTAPDPRAHERERGSLSEVYHWHIEITPRLITLAGFEWGTGLYINPVTPKEAARALRAFSA